MHLPSCCEQPCHALPGHVIISNASKYILLLCSCYGIVCLKHEPDHVSHQATGMCTAVHVSNIADENFVHAVSLSPPYISSRMFAVSLSCSILMVFLVLIFCCCCFFVYASALCSSSQLVPSANAVCDGPGRIQANCTICVYGKRRARVNRK